MIGLRFESSLTVSSSSHSLRHLEVVVSQDLVLLGCDAELAKAPLPGMLANYTTTVAIVLFNELGVAIVRVLVTSCGNFSKS